MTKRKHHLLKPEVRVKFMLAGKADMVVVSKKTGEEIFYRIQRPADGGNKVRFVMTRDRPDISGNDLVYMGFIGLNNHDDIMPFLWGERKAGVPKGDYRVRSFEWMWYKLARDIDVDEQVEIYHIGKCGRCGRKLLDPNSIEAGLGPICRMRVKNINNNAHGG